MLTTAGKLTRALSFKTDFPYIEVQDGSGNPILTSRIAVSGLKVVVTDGNPMTYVITVDGSACTALPKTAHQIQLFTGAVGGVAQSTIVADASKTLTGAADKIIQTYSVTIT
jgi:hypothetical protein